MKPGFYTVELVSKVFLKTQFQEGSASKPLHMGAELQNSFKGGPRGPLYGKLTPRHHRLRDYVSPNQTCKVFGDFGQKSWPTSRHVFGHVTRATCLLGVPWDGPWVVDSFRHWNFSICSKNIGVMAILVEGYSSKIFLKSSLSRETPFPTFFVIIPLH